MDKNGRRREVGVERQGVKRKDGEEWRDRERERDAEWGRIIQTKKDREEAGIERVKEQRERQGLNESQIDRDSEKKRWKKIVMLRKTNSWGREREKVKRDTDLETEERGKERNRELEMEGLKERQIVKMKDGEEWKEKGRKEIVRERKIRSREMGRVRETFFFNGEKLIRTCKEKMYTMGEIER